MYRTSSTNGRERGTARADTSAWPTTAAWLVDQSAGSPEHRDLPNQESQSDFVSANWNYDEIAEKYRTFTAPPDAHLPHTCENFLKMTTAVTVKLGGAQAASVATRPMLMDALREYKRSGGLMLGGCRPSTPEVKLVVLEMARFVKGTVRDVVAANPDGFSVFLRDIIPMLKCTGEGYPEHRVLASFLQHYLSPEDILGDHSPFNVKRWLHVNNKNTRSRIVCEALRTVL